MPVKARLASALVIVSVITEVAPDKMGEDANDTATVGDTATLSVALAAAPLEKPSVVVTFEAEMVLVKLPTAAAVTFTVTSQEAWDARLTLLMEIDELAPLTTASVPLVQVVLALGVAAITMPVGSASVRLSACSAMLLSVLTILIFNCAVPLLAVV